jgi:hypothetical protein
MSIDPVALAIALVSFLCGAAAAYSWLKAREKQTLAEETQPLRGGGGGGPIIKP